MQFPRLACPQDSSLQDPEDSLALVLPDLPGTGAALPTLPHQPVFFHLLSVSWELAKISHTLMGPLLSFLL